MPDDKSLNDKSLNDKSLNDKSLNDKSLNDKSLNDKELLRVLAGIQARGAIGEVSLIAAIAHADHFVAALPTTIGTLADLGSGGGLPGLVIAVRRPEILMTLVERRRSRADLLQRAVLALRLSDHVQVLGGDVRQLTAARPHSFDAVTARSFGAPAVTARWAGELLLPHGFLVVSEPPEYSPNRWPEAVLAAAGLIDRDLHDIGKVAGVKRFQKAAT